MSLQEKVVASLFDQSEDIADSITHSQPLMRALEESDRIIYHQGAEKYRKPVMYNQTASGGFYTGLGNFNILQKQDFTAFEFEIRQAYEPYVVSGREVRANKGSKHRLLDLLKTKAEVTKGNLKNTLHTSIMGDGTSYGGIGFDGIQLAVAASPSSGTYGGITRSGNTYTQNVVHTVSGGLTASNVQAELTAAMIKVARDSRFPNIAIAGATAWKHLHSSLTAIQRINDEGDKGQAGMRYLVYDGIKYYFDGGFGNNSGTASFGANHVRILNTEYVSLDVETSTWCKPLDGADQRPVDQDGVFVVMIAEGNLCVSAPQLQVLVKEA